MGLRPLLSSLLHKKAGAALIALQVAVTLAVLCNALFIIRQQTMMSRQPSGVGDEASVFVMTNQWAGATDDLAAREKADLAALRALPQVADATVSEMHPLGGPVDAESITLHPDQPGSGVLAASYDVDDHGLNTLGLRLIAGRNFNSDEVVNQNGAADEAASLGGVIVTQSVARSLSPDGKVLGRMAVIGQTTAPIIGVVAQLQSTPLARALPFASASMFLPYRWEASQVFYIVRAKPGQLAAAMTAARNQLLQISGQRIIVDMQTLADARRESYRGPRSVTLIMDVVCVILLGVTTLGIVGLTSYWVSQRRRIIGIRRAIGATRVGILRYFQTENLLIVAGGSIVGVVLGVAANLWMLQSMVLARMPVIYPLVGVIAMFVLGQLAVLWPALHAAAVPPAVVTRTV